MASLYKRATLSQARILRIVEGAVKNATDAHPELDIGPRHRRSIAKRAAGTLTASWPDVLAARESVRSDSDGDENSWPLHRRSSHTHKAITPRTSQLSRHPGLRHLRSKLAYAMKRVRAEEHPEYTRAMIDVLRMIASLDRPHE